MFETPQQAAYTARIQRDGAEVELNRARHDIEATRKHIANHEAAANEALLFGWLRTPTARRHERLAEQARQDLEDCQRTQTHAQTRLAQREEALLEADEDLREHRAQIAREDEIAAELDREQQREATAGQRVRDAVESDEISEHEAYADDGLVRPEIHDREVRKLEAEDGLDDLWWSSPSDDGGYAEAAEEARQDQIEVMNLDRSIDAGERTHDEVYTPEGHIRGHLLFREEPEADTEPAPERGQTRDATPEREQRTPDIEFDEPF